MSGAIIAMQTFGNRPGCRISALELEDVEAGVTIDDVHQSAVIHVNVVRLRRVFTRRRLGNEPADLLRRAWIGHIHDAQATGKPCTVKQGIAAFHVFLELMPAETPGGGTAPGRIEFTNREYCQRLDMGGVGDVEGP